MLYLAIDQHSKQLTVNLRNEEGDVLLKRQVSTQWDKVRAFFEQIRTLSIEHEGFVAILEVCGFNDWLIVMLRQYGCHEIVLIQPEEKSNKKTDRRDADQLGQILWVNRRRLLDSQRVQGVRRVRILKEHYQENRRLTMMRLRTTRQLTRTINRVKQILRRHNLEQHQPTKGIQTRQALSWLRELELPVLDRLAMDHLLEQWKLWQQQLNRLDDEIDSHCERSDSAQRIGTLTGRAGFCSLTLASRIGPIEDFPTARSLANYFGLTPRCDNSGQKTHRLGAITKEGSPVARYVLGQLVLHMLRRDAKLRKWHRAIKLRRGSKVARVAVMRRLTVIIWNMLKFDEPYVPESPPRTHRTSATPANLSAAHG